MFELDKDTFEKIKNSFDADEKWNEEIKKKIVKMVLGEEASTTIEKNEKSKKSVF